jgi:hypothetical protein
MPEIKREVRPVEVNYICDACGQGMMARSGEMDPKTGDIEHRCLICDHQQTLKASLTLRRDVWRENALLYKRHGGRSR